MVYIEENVVSIIMPAYNAEKWIGAAIEKVKEQTYTNWELIIINDGSTDRTEEICREKGENDRRIRIFTQENKGPSAARNYGLDQMTGDYFTIIDCDDYLRCDALEIYLNAAKKYQADTVIAGYKIFNLLSGEKKAYNFGKETVFSLDHSINIEPTELLIQKGMIASNWNKLYSKRLSELRFNEELSLNEDVLFSLVALSHSRKVVAIDDTLYEYRIQNADSVSLKFHPELPDALEALEKQLMASQSLALRPGMAQWLMNYIHIQLRIICTKVDLKDRKKEYIDQVVKSYIFQKYGTVQNADTIKRKIGVILLRIGYYGLYIRLMQLKKRK